MDAHLDTHFLSDPLHEERFPSPKVGFRFHPTDEEIVGYYLKHKMNGKDSLVNHIVGEIDLCQCEPWDIPDRCLISSNDQAWYFFSRPDYKYSNSKRANRTTRAGFWKVTGKIRHIKAEETGREIGNKRSLVFYKKVSDSKPLRTSWVIHEYQSTNILPHQMHFVLCKLKHKADETIDHSLQDEGEPIQPMDAEVDNQRVQTDSEQVQQSHICPTGMIPGRLKSQIHSHQRVSDRHLPLTSCFDNQPEGLDLLDSSNDDEDPVKFADSCLSLDKYFTEKDVDLVELIEYQSGPSESSQKMKTSNLNDEAARSEEYQHMRTFVSGRGSAQGDEPIFGVGEGPIPLFSSRESIDKPLEDWEYCSYGRSMGLATCYSPPAIKSSTVSTVSNISCRYMKSKEPAKPYWNLRPTGSSFNDWEVSSICPDTTPSINRSHSLSVCIVNVLFGLAVFILIVWEMLIRH
ncbi:hypothetical protein P3X46_014945 [Hevea brasiliensis]|uniref:NAC domain-containing protein n=1 Tax=Hevea brasiliensis TaxID=3981 RepID=A0ABQ9LUC3_HEVBR|nr:NAC domain-containing protein 101 isoform X2 [Hevea brasiliensis]KAJ9171603.1 hypothetical protein P3X46_014945 [Hevea brasiliensis]KAJ9171604.1 hypothetical protein P3X46_014945 [Hevea brasiliensis]